MPEKKEKKKQPLYVKIFIALFSGIAFGFILNFLGGVNNPIINNYILPFLQFIGDLFIRLIKMIVVPLVFFCIIDAALSLGDIKKLRSPGKSDSAGQGPAVRNCRSGSGSKRTSGNLSDHSGADSVQPVPVTDKR